MNRAPDQPRPGRTRLRLVGVLLAAAALGAGCTGAEPASESSAGVSEQVVAADATAPRTVATEGAQPAQAGTVAPRQVLRAEIAVAAEDVGATARDVRSVAADVGATVSEESIGLAQTARSRDDGVTPSRPGTARLVLRVPPEQLAATLDRIAGLGQELSRTQSSEDVELTLVDLDSREATQAASVARVRALLEDAESLADVVSLEGELTSRTAELESLQAQRQSLAAQVALATLTVVLESPGAEPASDEPERGGFLGGLGDGWDAFTAAATGLAVVIGALLPFLLFAAVLAAPVLWWLRRARRRRAAPVLPPPAAAAAG